MKIGDSISPLPKRVDDGDGARADRLQQSGGPHMAMTVQFQRIAEFAVRPA